ncbi:MAG: alkaline shock response membrane anchor protein AmaP [Chloroflexota bacterium]|nr:alkaline shock response membrane anchor protein AmaP [Chloroflexota bacterium]
MAIFNRVVVVIVGLTILAGAIVVLLVATGVGTADVLLYGWFEPQLNHVLGSIEISIAISIAVILGMIAMLVFEFRPLQKPPPLLISSTEEGIVIIDADSICMLAESTAAVIHSVRDVRCRVRESTGGLVISCRALVILGSNVVEIGAEIQRKIKEAIERLIELPVVQVNVKVRYESIEARRLLVQ